MLRSVLGKSLWDQRRLLVAWATGVAAVTAIYASFYPSARQSAAQSVRNLPPAFRQAFNVTQMSSPAGYLEATVFNFIVPLLVLLFVAVVGARAIAVDEEAGTLDLLLAHPVSRAQVIGQRFGALVVSTAAVGAAVLIALLVVAGPGELDIPAANLAAMSLHLVLLGVCFGALALAIGAATGRRALVYGGTAAAGLLAYFGNTLAPQLEAVPWLQRLSPFAYYSGGHPLRQGLQLGDAGLLVAVAGVLVGLGAVAFTRRDVAV